MMIWRNLDLKILAQFLIQASESWRSRQAAAHEPRDIASRPAAVPSRGPLRSASQDEDGHV
jgi:hypothetical protein